jgi:hypothetical protein
MASIEQRQLARFLEWRRRTAAKLEHLEEAHRRAIEALGGESITRKKIDDLLKAMIAYLLRRSRCGTQILKTI